MQKQHPSSCSLKENMNACAAASKLNLAATKAELKDLRLELTQVEKTLAMQRAEEESDHPSSSGRIEHEKFNVRLSFVKI